jgi:cation:H+ antiporter
MRGVFSLASDVQKGIFPVILDLLFVVLGIIGLYYGADFLVKGAARLAASFGVPAIVVGLTVVAYGTSMPEQIVSLTAAFRDTSDISVGNVVGSNIANILLILGVTGLIFPIPVDSRFVRREIPIMLGVSFLAYALALWGSNYTRPEGILLFGGVITFSIASYFAEKREDPTIQAEAQEFEEVAELLIENPNSLLEAGRTLLGILILVAGAQLTVTGAVNVAEAVGISDAVIGLTLVAIGTSLPELATSLVAALRKESDISVGNLVGSNIFNLMSILGLTSIVQPINVSREFLRYDYPIMIAVALLLWMVVLRDKKIGKVEAGVFMACYIAYNTFLFLR